MMASENETVEEIVKEMRYRVETNERAGIHPGNRRLYTDWADRIEAAHRREVAELREFLKEAVKSYCEGCNDFIGGKQKCEPCECKARKWRKALEGVNDEGK